MSEILDFGVFLEAEEAAVELGCDVGDAGVVVGINAAVLFTPGGPAGGRTATCIGCGTQGYIDPKYIVLGVTYAPPGPQSYVSYTNSTTVATTNSLSNSFTSSTTYSVSLANTMNIGGWKVGTSVGTSNTATQSQKDTQTSTLNWSVANTVKTSGTPTLVVNVSYTSPVDHDYDIVYVAESCAGLYGL